MGLLLLTASAQALTVETDFEGASARQVEIDNATQTVSFMPGGDPARGWPCWWQFRIAGLEAGKALKLKLRASDLPMPQAQGKPAGKPLAEGWAMPERAAWSIDGKTWQQTAPGQRQDGVMTYALETDAAAVFVAWGPPYTPAQAAAFVQRMAAMHPAAKAKELCQSREGRGVPMLHIQEGESAESRRPAIWVQARQHAWESGASWVCQGFTELLLSDAQEARWLRGHAEIFIVPIMDVDNTATGNGGKDALPQDHNRDWSERPNWNEVAAAQRKIQSLAAEGRMDVFLDLHNPAPKDLQAFFFAGPRELLSDEGRQKRDLFVQLAREAIGPAMPMLAEPKITGPSYHPLWKQISGQWVQAHGNPQTLALCLETPWNIEQSTVTGYKAVGAGLAQALRRYMAAQAKP